MKLLLLLEEKNNKDVLHNIRQCTICEKHLPLGPRPIVTAHPDAKIVIVGQAPGTKVHASGIPWDDASGKQLRKWLDVSEDVFYDETKFAIIPMGFCYPGKREKNGRFTATTRMCTTMAQTRHLQQMLNIELIILIGMYAQNYYLGKEAMKTLTGTVKNYQAYLPKYLPLPHPSPRNRFWLTKNPWFEKEVVSVLQEHVVKLVL